MNVGNASARELLPLCLFQGTHAGEEPFVISLEMAPVTIHPSNDMSEFTLQGNHMKVISVVKPSVVL